MPAMVRKAAHTTQGPPARLALTCTAHRRGGFDGAWWPRSRDFTAEAPALLTALQHLGRYTRATVGLGLWPGIPHPFDAAGTGILHWGGFATGEDPHCILLFCVDDVRQLLVIPPQTDPAAAAWLMTAACTADETRGATQLLDDAPSR
jgi:hypothetical protein